MIISLAQGRENWELGMNWDQMSLSILLEDFFYLLFTGSSQPSPAISSSQSLNTFYTHTYQTNSSKKKVLKIN